MYASRVLPPPPALAGDIQSSPRPGPVYGGILNPKPDALLEHKIMTNYDHNHDTSSSSTRARSQSPRALAHQAEGRISPRRRDDDEYSVAISSGGTKRKRTPPAGQLPDQQSSSKISNNPNPTGSRDSLPSFAEAGALATKTPVDSPSQICLCQPDPKVPRPRNAFILYRQHHQAKVVAEHPGLANPEISKIIGDLWRHSSPEIKQHWKNLAEEEKARHQKQYPDYRYQPKRGRNSVPTTIPPGQGSPRCLKCGGKSMAAPQLSSPGFRSANTVATASSVDQPPPSPFTAGMPPRTPYGVGPAYAMSPGGHAYISRAVIPQVRPSDRSPAVESPDAKRRRYESIGVRLPGRNHGLMSGIPPTPVEQHLPRPDFMKPNSGSFAMPPNSMQRPHHQHNHSYGNVPTPISATPNDMLRLAPIQTRQATDILGGQAKSVEAMIMSINTLWKIKILAKISSPLQKPGPGSPPYPTRGAVIAVEGTDFAAMEAVGAYIRSDLERRGEHMVRAWESPQLESFDEHGQAKLGDVLQLMTHWHGISSEVVKYITRVPFEDPEYGEPISPISKWPIHESKEKGNSGDRATSIASGSDAMDFTVGNGNGRHTPDSRNDSTGSSIMGGGLASRKPVPIPVALIPNYQLTTTDYAASVIPISDYYSPVDHWRWVAALWRGTVGPDVVICIRGVDDVVDGSGSPRAGTAGPGGVVAGNGNVGHHPAMMNGGMMSGGGGGKPSSRSSVDVRLEDARTVVVRCERKGEVSEQVLRRVAFEVGEWLRGRDERER